MEFLDDPEEMTPEARQAEVAAILAAGYLRVRRSRPFTEKELDSSDVPLPLCPEGSTDGEPISAEVSG